MRHRRLIASIALAQVLGLLLACSALAGHGPTRQGTDACNGTDAFDVNNVTTREVVDTIASQNPGARRADGSIDRTKITHALLKSSGHVALQVREKAGFPLTRVAFEFAPTDPGWAGNSTNHPGYLTAIDAQENLSADADSDLFVGRTFAFNIPTDVVGDGNYVARLRAFRADGGEAGRLCLDALVSNGQNAAAALKANTDPAYEPPENPAADYGFVPQPLVWFPAGEPTAAQQAGYGAKTARIEFLERLGQVKVEREQPDPADPTGVAKIWVDYTSQLASDDFRRPHFLAGGRMDGTGLESGGNEKVWGPGYRFAFDPLANVAAERLRISGTDTVGKSFCGIYTFGAGANGSFVPSAPAACS